MSQTCPFCKRSVPVPGGACPSCGRSPPNAKAAPSAPASWDDDDLGGGLDLSRGGAPGPAEAGPSAYAGGGLSLGDDDDPFADAAPAAGLELDLPPSHAARSERALPAAPAPPPDVEVSPPSVSRPGVSRPGAQPAADAAAPTPPAAPPPQPAKSADPALLIARYPQAPEKVWQAPGYAMKVLLRQLELRQDLASLRKRRSPDVALYERALNVHDAKTFQVGLAISLAGFFVATVIFFLPVILRFLHAPD